MEKEEKSKPFDLNLPVGMPLYDGVRDSHLSAYWSHRNVSAVLARKGEVSKQGLNSNGDGGKNERNRMCLMRELWVWIRTCLLIGLIEMFVQC